MKIIITESQLTDLVMRRRIASLEKYVKEAYEWLDAKKFKNYNQFFRRGAISAINHFIVEEFDSDLESSIKFRDEILHPMVEYIEKTYGDDIRTYYDKEISK